MMRPVRRHLWVLLLAGLSACGGVKLGDALTRDLPPGQAAACRQAVADELTRQGVRSENIRLIHYQKQTTSLRGASREGSGYQAWVYPKVGRDALIIELSEGCQVRGVRVHRAGDGRSDGAMGD